MEVPGMNEVESSGSHLTSAAAFVEGGIQEACEDACSICLEAFCENDPSSVTSCKHEYHLQCILEWCQRSSSCPMCWQPISLKDPASQELLEAVEQERSFRANPARNSTIFRHPTLGDFELQHLPVGVNDLDLEDRIIQHLAAAAAMGRAHHIARREGSRGRSSSHGRPQFLVFSTHPNSPNAGPVSASIAPVGEELESGSVANPSSPISSGGGVESPQHMPQISSSRSDQVSASSGGSVIRVTNRHGTSVANRSSPGDSSTPNQDRGGPSDLHSLSENWKSRFSALSTRYKESISKSTKGWKDKLFTKSTSMADIGSEVKREVNAGIASVSRMMERLETRENSRGSVSLSSNAADSSATEQTLSNRDDVENHHSRPLGGDNGPGALATN